MNKDRLVQEIKYELGQLRQLGETAGQLSAIKASERRSWDSAAAAKYISDLVLGLENLCKRRNAALGRVIAESPDSHQNLLDDFLQDKTLGGKLSPEVALRLKKYLRFRHRFMHGYGHEINWEIIDEPLKLLPETVSLLADIWETWTQELPA